MADENDIQESTLNEETLDQLLNDAADNSAQTEQAENESTMGFSSQPGGEETIRDLISDSSDVSDVQVTDDELQSVTEGISTVTESYIGKEEDVHKAGVPLEELYDVNVKFTVELGRTFMFIKDILLLGEGSIVELDKNVGDEVDILVNDRLFGRGKLVLVDEFYGVQITQILHPAYFKNL